MKRHQQPPRRQAELLGEGGEDEIGGALGDELQVRLRPAMKPLPVTPPEPMAIMPWMMWKPLPSGSVVGSSSVQMRCFFW